MTATNKEHLFCLLPKIAYPPEQKRKKFPNAEGDLFRTVNQGLPNNLAKFVLLILHTIFEVSHPSTDVGKP